MRTVEYDTSYSGKYPSEAVRRMLWEYSGKPSDLVTGLFSKFGYSTDWSRLYDISNPRRLDVLRKLEKQLTAVIWALDGNINEKTILDLGCGSKDCPDKKGNVRIDFEPWLARVLHRMGVKVVGIDVGDLSQEEFETYNLDLLNPNSLNSFADQSFDLVHSSALYSSSELQERVEGHSYDGSLNAAGTLVRILKPQIARILKPTGFYVFREQMDYLTMDNSGYQIGESPLYVLEPKIILERQL